MNDSVHAADLGESPEDMIRKGLSLLCQNDTDAKTVITTHMENIVLQLSRYVREIEVFNPALSLVGTDDRRELVTKHILDSLSPLGIMLRKTSAFAGGLCVADVGSGAGLPGIPLAVAMPDARFTLIERKGRRAGFLRNTVKTLGLSNVFVEEQEMEKVKNPHFSLVVFRAFRPLDPRIHKKLARLCVKNGILAAYKGRREKTEEEMAALEKAVPSLAGRWEILPCPVPMLDEQRHLTVITVDR